jgi:putative radical SAM enzyme (TIGR03279 family)
VSQKLSPLFVSVHATDPEVRGRLLGRKEAEPILPRLESLANVRIQLHTQIVLCPGYNDGDVLRRTIDDLEALHPENRGTYGGVVTVAIVPVGLTQFRDKLPGLTTCSPEYSRSLLEELETRRAKYRKTLGANFVFPSDEFYLNAGLPLPSAKHYEGFKLLEDGIGLVRQFMDDHDKLAKKIHKFPALTPARSATLITGELASSLVNDLANTLNKVEGLSVNVAAIHNSFFEGNITVTGLLTGQDVERALIEMGDELGEIVVAPSVMLRESEDHEFIDNMTIGELSEKINRKIVIVDRFPHSVAEAIL